MIKIVIHLHFTSTCLIESDDDDIDLKDNQMLHHYNILLNDILIDLKQVNI